MKSEDEICKHRCLYKGTIFLIHEINFFIALSNYFCNWDEPVILSLSTIHLGQFSLILLLS